MDKKKEARGEKLIVGYYYFLSVNKTKQDVTLKSTVISYYYTTKLILYHKIMKKEKCRWVERERLTKYVLTQGFNFHKFFLKTNMYPLEVG